MKAVLLLTAWLVALVALVAGSKADFSKFGFTVPNEVSLVIASCSSKGGHVIGNECVFFSEEDDTIIWQEALETCSTKYGTMSSPADPEALLEFLSDNYAGIPFWVGGYSSPYQKSFRWINNTEIPLNSKDFPWGGDQPPSHPHDPLLSHQRCMVVDYGLGYAVQPCMNQQRYACTLNACGVLGGVTLGFQCLKFNEGPLNWEAANAACTSDGERLIVPAYPKLLFEYVTKQYNTTSKSNRFWVGGIQTDNSHRDSWFMLDGEAIPLNTHGADNFPWAGKEPNDDAGKEHCLVLESRPDLQGYNDENCDNKIKYICELETSTTQLPTPVQFVIPQIASGRYIGPASVFPYIQDNDALKLHLTLDPNMFMVFDIVDGIWGYIRHVSSGKILTPSGGKMKPSDGTRVVLNSDRRPWALFALDQYQNRIMHKSGKYIKPDREFITISGNESNNKTMEFLFMNTTNPRKEVLPYGYPVVSGDWQLVFSVLNPLATHTYSANIIVGRSSTQSTSSSFKFGFESETKIGIKVSEGIPLVESVEASVDQTFKASLSTEFQFASSATWKTEDKRVHSFTVVAGESIAIWQRAYIIKQGENTAVYLSNTFADTNSSSINPNNFNGSKKSRITEAIKSKIHPF